VSAGGGLGYFKENSTLESGVGANPGKTGATTGIFQFGAGLDVKLFSRVSVRGEVRDFFSGVPQPNVDKGRPASMTSLWALEWFTTSQGNP
jgi:hypothetical protein